MTRLIGVVLLLVVSTLACSGKTSGDRQDTLRAVAPTPPPAQSMVANQKEPCPHTGRWAICNVEQRLKQSGFVAKRDSGSHEKRAGFSVTPVTYTVGKESRLEVFIYPDEKAVSRDVAKLDTVRVVPIGETPAWNGTATFVRSANLLAVFIAENPRQIERLSLAITAGPPQPGSRR